MDKILRRYKEGWEGEEGERVGSEEKNLEKDLYTGKIKCRFS